MSQTEGRIILFVYFFNCLCYITSGKKFEGDGKPAWAKKDIRDYNEVDLERLLEQWEEDEEPLPEDELPEHLRTPPKLNFDPTNFGNPEDLLKMSKKGRTLMVFVRVRDKYTKEQADEITKIWQTSLWNNHIHAERYSIDDLRAIFMFKDGAQAWDAKDYLIEQEELQEVTIENKAYYGRFSVQGQAEEIAKTTAKKDAKRGQTKKAKVEL